MNNEPKAGQNFLYPSDNGYSFYFSVTMYDSLDFTLVVWMIKSGCTIRNFLRIVGTEFI